jgi:hypothetical protein
MIAHRYYPDVDNGTDATDDDLAAHYLSRGRAENRVSQRLRVVGTYEAGAGLALDIKFGGLCNQMYTHVGMLSVLLQMGAEVVRRMYCIPSKDPDLHLYP